MVVLRATIDLDGRRLTLEDQGDVTLVVSNAAARMWPPFLTLGVSPT